jgi:polyisoprenyl-teichoic acid--peptidoglycan teichoic acid transferase
MTDAKMAARRYWPVSLIVAACLLINLGLQSCRPEEASQTPTEDEQQTPSRTATPFSPHLSEAGATSSETRASEMTDTETGSIWGSFDPPSSDPATPIPAPLTDLSLTDEIMVWILLGSDTEPPFTGRMQAIHLVFIHPRFSKASLVSIPGDLFVYIPGFTMQRLSTAYALGGMDTVLETIAYNFGVMPDRFVLAHPGDFQWLVDDLDSIEVTVFYPMPAACGGIPAGRITMNGTLALCYVSHRDGYDEVDRMRRQQQLLRLVFLKLAFNGNLAKLPLLYASYEGWVKTDLSLAELMKNIPLALRLADPNRISYYMIGWEETTLWELPGYSQAKVFLPDREGVRAVIQQAIDDVLIPEPLSNQVQTLEAQLTMMATSLIVETATLTLTPTSTPTQTPTPGPSPTGPTPTPSATLEGYP